MLMSKSIDRDAQIGRRLKLRDLRVFFAVVECGSMAKAAAVFRMTQPAVSQVMVQLEGAVGVKLLDRSSRGVEPTIYGRALLARAHAAFDELKQGLREIEFLADPTSGELRIGCAEPFAASILPPIVRRFSQRFPRVAIRVNETAPLEEQSQLDERENDLLMGLWVKPRVLSARAMKTNIETLFEDHLVVAAGVNSRWVSRRRIDLDELKNERWVLPPPGSWAHSGTAEAFRAKGLDPPKVILTSYSVPLRADALANGPCLATFPESSVRLNGARYGLKVLPVDLRVAPRPAAVITFRNRTLSPLVEPFIACAREVAKSLAGKPKAPSFSEIAEVARRSG
jgi:DNA-binding transcriptional LysR family regulator